MTLHYFNVNSLSRHFNFFFGMKKKKKKIIIILACNHIQKGCLFIPFQDISVFLEWGGGGGGGGKSNLACNQIQKTFSRHSNF